MAGFDDTNYDAELSWTRIAAFTLTGVALLIAVLAPVAAILNVYELAHQPQAVASAYVSVAVLTFLAWGLAALLWGLAHALRRVDELCAELRDGPRPALPERAAGPLTGRTTGTEEVAYLLRELRDIALLSEPERAARAKAESQTLIEQLERDVPNLLREHNWPEARRRVQLAHQRFPTVSNWGGLEQKIEQARSAVEAHDVEAATREVNDLMALGVWDRALDVVRHLQERHPASDRVAELSRRVNLGRDKATAQERAELMAKAQGATDRREWQQALRWAEALIARYPDAIETRELRRQIPTLRSNVEIQARQQSELQIRDLIRGRRFAEALRLAKEVIDRYPNSPQAAVLREQLPRIEERARRSW